MKIGNIIEPPSNWQSMYMRHALPEVCSIVQSRATVEVPENSAGKTFHVICEVTDDGTHNLTSYRRIIFEPVQ